MAFAAYAAPATLCVVGVVDAKNNRVSPLGFAHPLRALATNGHAEQSIGQVCFQGRTKEHASTGWFEPLGATCSSSTLAAFDCGT